MMEQLDAKWISARSQVGCAVEAPKVPARLGLTNMKVRKYYLRNFKINVKITV